MKNIKRVVIWLVIIFLYLFEPACKSCKQHQEKISVNETETKVSDSASNEELTLSKEDYDLFSLDGILIKMIADSAKLPDGTKVYKPFYQASMDKAEKAKQAKTESQSKANRIDSDSTYRAKNESKEITAKAQKTNIAEPLSNKGEAIVISMIILVWALAFWLHRKLTHRRLD